MPVALLGVVGLLRRQLRLGRVLLAIVLSVSLVMLGNLVRIAAIAGLIERWGIERGYELGHLLIGSLMSIAFVALGLLTLGGIIFRRSSQRPSLAVAP
jgi:exosortase/archaeosortase family protein